MPYTLFAVKTNTTFSDAFASQGTTGLMNVKEYATMSVEQPD